MVEFDVLCLGIVNLNVVFWPVPMNLMEQDVSLAKSVEYLCGGDAVNQAMVLSRLGLKATVSGKVGADAIGDMIRAQLSAGGVDTAAIAIDPDCGSGVCVVMTRPDGSRNFLSFRGGTERFCPKDFDPELLKKVRAVSVGSMFALKELDGAGIASILSEARSLGATTFADMKSDTYNIGYCGIREVMPHLDYFLPSYDEAAYLTGERDPATMAECFLSDGAKNVVIKLGGDGVYARAGDSGSGFYQNAYDVPVVDTTGAGDNFVAGFIAAVLEGKDLRQSTDFANCVASISVGVLGAHGGVTSRRQVDQFLAAGHKQK